MVSMYHDSKWVGAHMGRTKTYEAVKEKFYFPKMSEYISAYVNVCAVCQCSKHSKLRPQVPLGTIDCKGIWDLVWKDLWGPVTRNRSGNKYLLTVVDAFLKYCIPIALPDKEATTVASAIYHRVISDKGLMNRLHSDQGKEFCNKVLTGICELLGILKSQTTSYHPQGNAIVERVHSFFRSAITSFVNYDGTDWDELLSPLMLAYNNAIHSSLNMPPFEVFYGRKGNLPGWVTNKPVMTDGVMSYVQRIKWAMYRTQEVVYEQRALRHLKRKLDNLGLVIPVYKPGELVKLEVPRVKPGDSKKLKFLWSGPWKVVKQGNNPHVYYLEDDTGTELPAPVSVTRIMPWNHPHDYPILEKDVPPPKLVSIDSTGDKNDDRDLSTEDSVSYEQPMLVVNPQAEYTEVLDKTPEGEALDKAKVQILLKSLPPEH